MLNIAYAVNDTDLAERIQQDLTDANLRLDNHILIVLVSPESNADRTVQGAIKQSLSEDHLVLPVIVRDAPLPDSLRGYRSFKMTGKYKAPQLIHYVRRADIAPQRLKLNRRILFGLTAIVLVVFVISIASIGSGIIAFPEEEYATENALRNQQIETLVYPTIDVLLPRSTADALDFPRTVEAANTRNAPLLVLTATGIHEQRQATDSAIATAADMTTTARANATEAAND